VLIVGGVLACRPLYYKFLATSRKSLLEKWQFRPMLTIIDTNRLHGFAGNIFLMHDYPCYLDKTCHLEAGSLLGSLAWSQVQPTVLPTRVRGTPPQGG
jgi:hypothetical protein